MKSRAIAIALALLGASPGFAALEFSGYITVGKQTKFILADPAQNQLSAWLDLGQSFADNMLVEFDAKREILSVRKGDSILQLPLKPPSAIEVGGHKLASFRSFFSQEGVLTANDVEGRFGPPKYTGQLLLQDEDAQITRDHSVWNYQIGNDERAIVGVQIDGGKVKGVYYFRGTPSVTEVIRKP